MEKLSLPEIIQEVKRNAALKRLYSGPEHKKKVLSEMGEIFNNPKTAHEYSKCLIEYGLHYRFSKTSSELINILCKENDYKEHLKQLRNVNDIIDIYIDLSEKREKRQKPISFIEEEKEELIDFLGSLKSKSGIETALKKFARSTISELHSQGFSDFWYTKKEGKSEFDSTNFWNSINFMLKRQPITSLYSATKLQIKNHISKKIEQYSDGSLILKDVTGINEYNDELHASITLQNGKAGMLDCKNKKIITSLKTSIPHDIKAIHEIFFKKYTMVESYYGIAEVSNKTNTVLFEKERLIEKIDGLYLVLPKMYSQGTLLLSEVIDKYGNISTQGFARTQDMKRKHISKFEDESGSINYIDSIVEMNDDGEIWCYDSNKKYVKKIQRRQFNSEINP